MAIFKTCVAKSTVMASCFVLNYLKRIVSLLPLGLIIPIWIWADSNFVTTAKHAEKLFYEKLYGDALPLYAELLTFSSKGELKTQLRLRLATCYLEEGEPQTALAFLSSLETPFFHNQSLI